MITSDILKMCGTIAFEQSFVQELAVNRVNVHLSIMPASQVWLKIYLFSLPIFSHDFFPGQFLPYVIFVTRLFRALFSLVKIFLASFFLLKFAYPFTISQRTKSLPFLKENFFEPFWILKFRPSFFNEFFEPIEPQWAFLAQTNSNSSFLHVLLFESQSASTISMEPFWAQVVFMSLSINRCTIPKWSRGSLGIKRARTEPKLKQLFYLRQILYKT